MADRSLVFRAHATSRMLERDILLSEVRDVLLQGEVIERYPDDRPFPSRLVLGWAAGRALHVVAADDAGSLTFVITAYEPDPDEWEPGFRIRRAL